MLLPNTTAAVCLRPQVCHTYKRNYQFTTNGHIWNPINLTLIKKELITKPEADQFMRATIHGNMQASNGYWSHHPAARWVTTKVHPHVGCTRHRKKNIFVWKLFCKWRKGEFLQQYSAGCSHEAPTYHREKLPEATVLITSHPWASDFFTRNIRDTSRSSKELWKSGSAVCHRAVYR